MDASPADTTVIVVLTSTSIVIPGIPDSTASIETATPAPTATTTTPTDGFTGAVTTLLITSERTVEVTQSPSSTPYQQPSASSPTQTGAGSSNGHSPHPGGLSNAAKIAMGVAIPCGVMLLLASIGLCFWRLRRRSKATREKRLAEINDYSYNPNLDNGRSGGHPRPDSLTTLNGGPAVGSKTKPSSDDQNNTTSTGNYRGWGPAPEDVASTTAQSTTPNMAGMGMLGMANDPSLVSSTPQMAQGYAPTAHRSNNYPPDSSPLSTDQTLGPGSPTGSPLYRYEPNRSSPPLPNQASQPPTAITSDQVIAPPAATASATSPSSPPPNPNSMNMPANTVPQRIYDQPPHPTPEPFHTHQPQYSSLFSPAPEESRRVASNF